MAPNGIYAHTAVWSHALRKRNQNLRDGQEIHHADVILLAYTDIYLKAVEKYMTSCQWCSIRLISLLLVSDSVVLKLLNCHLICAPNLQITAILCYHLVFLLKAVLTSVSKYSCLSVRVCLSPVYNDRSWARGQQLFFWCFAHAHCGQTAAGLLLPLSDQKHSQHYQVNKLLYFNFVTDEFPLANHPAYHA